ncbi:uncharacterized protein LOC131498836 [Neofelis nebulosa]|uniref:uncharacterized protein LOC131498836 n=1 Tax=Neofelis nebulosa TaxID=61452 RepID=UPI00272BCD9E|nr:uncharacterized protein LOC131498836 [Neofelis nebulosa]XP_058562226.1 uncharacterized protein LOC131498836 [Neofelis nebulosa]XP_058562227.1 uncharacterized protein LOC131498836 [Neofelis nebulosa]
MLQLLTSLALLGALATPAGTSKTCPVCSLLGNCTEMTCPPTKEACVFGQMQLENGTLIRNGSCVSECREGVYTLTYSPHSSLWVSTDCCVNGCGRAARQEAGSEAQLNGVQCPYCSGDKSASCDSLSVMNCTGDQTMCLTLNGTWNGGGPQILKGCATPNVCHLQVNTTLGPEASGFRLVSQPECNYVVTPTLPGPPANTSLTTDRVTVCVTCSGLNTCDAVLCPADRNYCLQTAGILALGKGDSVVWRSGSCVALRDCLFGSSVSAFTSSVDFGFQINSTCCQGNCQALTPPEGVPASHPLSGFLCPTCPNGHPGPCNSSFYVQCPVGETECVQLDLLSIEGSQNVTLRGCGSQNLCGVPDATAKALLTFPGHRLAQQPHCSTSRRAILESECPSGAPPGLRLARSVLLVALGFLALS